MNEVRASGLDH
jgi:hypothetical protein